MQNLFLIINGIFLPPMPIKAISMFNSRVEEEFLAVCSTLI